MSGPKRNPDKLNTIGIVVVGICGAVLVYVTIVALQAFYMNDSSDVQTMADYGGQETTAKNLRAEQVGHLADYGSNPAPAPGKPGEPVKQQTYHIPIDRAKDLVVDAVKADPANLVPTQGRSEKATVQPIYGRPKLIAPPAPAVPEGAGSGSGAGSAAPAPAAPAPTGGTPPLAPMQSTGTGLGRGGALDPVSAPGGTKTPSAPAPTSGSAAKGNGG